MFQRATLKTGSGMGTRLGAGHQTSLEGVREYRWEDMGHTNS